jgi:dual specificity tyrosine-phosphorylation-regulated kinase 2/3/4
MISFLSLHIRFFFVSGYSSFLTPFEQSEILEHQQVWFLGNSPNKVRGIPQAANNNGYDDERGDYTIVLHDQLVQYYSNLCLF